MITFEKTPFEKEMTESEHDCETGYTLRNRQTRTDASADTGYSLRTRPVRCSWNPSMTMQGFAPFSSFSVDEQF